MTASEATCSLFLFGDVISGCALKTLPLTVIVAKSYIQPSIIQPATDDARPTGFQKRPFKRKHQQPPVQCSGSKGF
jgi:hypothetical protein